LTSVTDGTGRSITYALDANLDLVTFTDANAKNTTFTYNVPGQMTQIFYPANPTIAFVTNVYDTLGRVKTQTDALSNLWTYYFAGFRSQERVMLRSCVLKN
jgi:YD repeat-containing protein